MFGNFVAKIPCFLNQCTSDDRLLPLDVTFASLATEFPQIGQNKYPNSRGESHDTHFFFLKAAMLSLETKHPENRGKTYAISTVNRVDGLETH